MKMPLPVQSATVAHSSLSVTRFTVHDAAATSWISAPTAKHPHVRAAIITVS
jgi:hypothetical protein